jgi:hypothetical protein
MWRFLASWCCGLRFQLFVKAKVVAWPRKAELFRGPADVVVSIRLGKDKVYCRVFGNN